MENHFDYSVRTVILAFAELTNCMVCYLGHAIYACLRSLVRNF